MLWKKLTAQVDIIQSNGMIEAANKILKYRYLYPKTISGMLELEKELHDAVIDFNAMPNGQLYGFTPNEVLSGAIPSTESYKEQIHLTTFKRMQENRTFNCRLSCHL
jgi:hypothetical protein